LVVAAVVALAATAIFHAGSLAVPGISGDLMADRFAERVTVESIPGLIERRERLDEVRTFLEGRIKGGTIHDMLYAYRGRLEAVEHGPEAGFLHLAKLLSGLNLNEMVGGWVELARLAAQADRWEDFFQLATLLADYGEMQTLQALMVELRQSGLPINRALQTPAGIQFLVHAGWDRKALPDTERLDEEARQSLALWRAQQEIRFDSKLSDPSTTSTLQALPADDPRPRYLLEYQQNQQNPKHLPEVFAQPPLLTASNFTLRGQPLRGSGFYSNAVHEAQLDSPVRGPLWMVVSTSAVLHIHPLTYVWLDEEMQVHYLPYPRPFPVKLERRDANPFSTVRVEFVNDLSSERLKLDRNIQLHGIYGPQEEATLRPAAE